MNIDPDEFPIISGFTRLPTPIWQGLWENLLQDKSSTQGFPN